MRTGWFRLKEFIDPNERRCNLLIAWRAKLFIEAGKVFVEFCDLGKSVQLLSKCRRCDTRHIEVCPPRPLEQLAGTVMFTLPMRMEYTPGSDGVGSASASFSGVGKGQTPYRSKL